ncbi:MAG: putative toxin-antitoxin system toxin component, PIN family [Candidatus Andersenbacteria bacterium]|nr:putative toxin-antitoxin system toxin component, PIN family [Candidatus Andersenbacteria bacterium]MBI3250450.1 putative toxin-antitoxin system toxin component, PIN family [Candidatus Andersenbacteria bacterium]
MRVVLDTNVLINSTSDPFSAATQLLEAAVAGEITALATPAVKREYKNIVGKLVNQPEDSELIENFLSSLHDVRAESTEVIIDDLEDLKFIEAAVGGDADVIITSDKHLLDVGEVEAVRIISPTEAVAGLNEDGGEWHQWAKGLGIGQ